MRADEYLVIEIQKLKEENKLLKEENNKLLKVNETTKEDVSKSTIIDIKDKVQIVYTVNITSEYYYKSYFLKEDTENKIKTLRKCLTNDKTLKELIVQKGNYYNDKPYGISDFTCHFETTYKGHKTYIHFYEYNDKLEGNILVEKPELFLNYEDALKYAQKESRKVIENVIKEYEKNKKQQEEEKENVEE